MATIQDYLDLIKNAIYGKDVRQAIHDGIQQCYYDGHAGATDLEARQRLTSLGSRMSTAEDNINTLDARVDQIVAPSGEAPSAAEVADGRIVDGVTYNLIGDAIRAVNTNSKSALNSLAQEILNASWERKSVITATGEFLNNTARLLSSEIKVNTKRIYCNDPYYFVAYVWDSDGTYIGRLNTDGNYTTGGTTQRLKNWTNPCDGKKYRIVVCRTDDALLPISESVNILSMYKSFVTPQDFGAVANGQNDDSQAFYEALSYSDVVYLPKGHYLIDFQSVDITNKTIYGDGYSTVIEQNTPNESFCRVGVYSTVKDIRFIAHNTEQTPLFRFGEKDGDFVKFNNHTIKNIYIDGDASTQGFLFTLRLDAEQTTQGNSGGSIENVSINNCKDGINVSLYDDGWLTKQSFRDIRIINPSRYGVRVYKANPPRGQFTHSVFDNVSVSIKTADVVAFNLAGCSCTFINPSSFNDNPSGTSYCIDVINETRQPYEISTIIGGFLEGMVKNEVVLKNQVSVFGTMLIRRENHYSEHFTIETYNNIVDYIYER